MRFICLTISLLVAISVKSWELEASCGMYVLENTVRNTRQIRTVLSPVQRSFIQLRAFHASAHPFDKKSEQLHSSSPISDVEFLSTTQQKDNFEDLRVLSNAVDPWIGKKKHFSEPTYDPTFKMIFGEQGKLRMIDFLNNILGLSSDKTIESIEYLSEANTGIYQEKRSVIFDIKCEDRSGTRYIVEMQKARDAAFFKRIQYYSARELVAQGEYLRTLKIPTGESIEKTQYYAGLLPVRTVAVLNYPVTTANLHSGKNVVSSHIVVNKDNNIPTLDLMDWTIIELTKFNKDIKQLATDLDRWLYFLKMSKFEIQVDEKLWEGNYAIKSAYGRLLTMTTEEKRAYESAIKSESDYNSLLGSAKAEGRTEEKQSMAKKMIKKGLDVNSITEITGLDPAIIEQLGKYINNSRE